MTKMLDRALTDQMPPIDKMSKNLILIDTIEFLQNEIAIAKRFERTGFCIRAGKQIEILKNAIKY